MCNIMKIISSLLIFFSMSAFSATPIIINVNPSASSGSSSSGSSAFPPAGSGYAVVNGQTIYFSSPSGASAPSFSSVKSYSSSSGSVNYCSGADAVATGHLICEFYNVLMYDLGFTDIKVGLFNFFVLSLGVYFFYIFVTYLFNSLNFWSISSFAHESSKRIANAYDASYYDNSREKWDFQRRYQDSVSMDVNPLYRNDDGSVHDDTSVREYFFGKKFQDDRDSDLYHEDGFFKRFFGARESKEIGSDVFDSDNQYKDEKFSFSSLFGSASYSHEERDDDDWRG